MVEAKAAETMAAKMPVEELGMTPSETAAAAEGLILPRSNTPSGYKNVTFNQRDNKWSARRFTGGVDYFIGNFPAAGEAALHAARWGQGIRDEAAVVAAAAAMRTRARTRTFM